MSNKYITAYYVDAQDGRPANEAKLRHGPKLPSPQIKVNAVDRRLVPALIIGTMPASEPLAPGMTLIDKAEHDSLLAGVDAWRVELEIAANEKRRAGMVLSRFQARAVLRRYGYREALEQIMNDPETDPLAVDAWNDAGEFRRTSPMLKAMAIALGINDEDLDAMFEEGAGIEA